MSLVLAVILCSASNAACGSSESGGNSGGAGTGGLAGAGGASGGTAGAAVGGSAGAGSADITSILLATWAGHSAWSDVDYWLAWWHPLGDLPAGKRCSGKMVGACRLNDCRTSIYGTDPPPAVPDATLGDVLFTSGTSSCLVQKMSSQGDNGKCTGPGWQPGETIVVTTTGGLLEPFTVSLQYPSPLEMSDPPLGALANYEASLDATKPIVVKWKPTDWQVLVHLYQREVSLKHGWDGVQVECTFDGTAGEGTFPLEMVQGYFVADPEHEKLSAIKAFHAHFENLTVSGLGVQAYAANYSGGNEKAVTFQ